MSRLRDGRPAWKREPTFRFHREDCSDCGRSLVGRWGVLPMNCVFCGASTSWEGLWRKVRRLDLPAVFDDHCATCALPLVGRFDDLPSACPRCERTPGDSSPPTPKEQTLLVRHMHLFEERDQLVVRAAWQTPRPTLAEIGRAFGVIPERIRQIARTRTARLRAAVYQEATASRRACWHLDPWRAAQMRDLIRADEGPAVAREPARSRSGQPYS